MLKDLFEPYHDEQHLKKDLASHFKIDARDHFIRGSLFLHDEGHYRMSKFAKVYVDLRFSVECALKSMIISLSPKSESAEDAYKKCRKHGHNLINLYNEVKSRNIGGINLLKVNDENILLDEPEIDVNFRYEINLYYNLIFEEFVERETLEGRLSKKFNFDFIVDYSQVVSKILEINKEIFDKYISKYNGFVGNDHDLFRERQKQFAKNIDKLKLTEKQSN